MTAIYHLPTLIHFVAISCCVAAIELTADVASGAEISVTMRGTDTTVGAGGEVGVSNSNHRPPAPGPMPNPTAGTASAMLAFELAFILPCSGSQLRRFPKAAM